MSTTESARGETASHYAATRAAGHVRLEGITVNLPSLADAKMEVIRRATLGKGFTLFTLNLDHLAKLQTDSAFRAAYRNADLVTADGWPIVWLARREGSAMARTCGSDMVDPLCAAAAVSGLRIYFVGPGPEAQGAALRRLRERHPGLMIAGAETPYISDPTFDNKALAARINASGAHLCFLSLGAPKQELLADKLAPLCTGVGLLCVGAALDFIAGTMRRAPRWMQRTGLEWLWRLAGDPRRLATRYLRCAIALSALLLRRTNTKVPVGI